MAVISDQNPVLRPSDFADLKSWESDNHLDAFNAFLVSARHMIKMPYKTRDLGVDGIALCRAANIALNLFQKNNSPSANMSANMSASVARQFFEQEFVPHKVITKEGNKGFVTGFYEPLVPASLKQSDRFPIPLYRRPSDLIDVGDDNRPQGMDPYFRFGRRKDNSFENNGTKDNGIEEYLDRLAIQSGALKGQGLELVWLENKTDAYFIHIQGSAKLALDNGETMRVTYAAKSGHPYTSVAKILCQQTGVAPQDMTADWLADWMRENPIKLDTLLAHNRSYIFFKQVHGLQLEEGPIAAAKTSLIAGRSLAIDRALHTFGVPIWLTLNKPLPDEKQLFNRLMFAHDTGSAIVGPARGDIFTGTGEQAGFKAGRIRHAAAMTVLVPNP